MDQSLKNGGPLYFLEDKNHLDNRMSRQQDVQKTNEIIVNVKQEFTGVTKGYSPKNEQRKIYSIVFLRFLYLFLHSCIDYII